MPKVMFTCDWDRMIIYTDPRGNLEMAEALCLQRANGDLKYVKGGAEVWGTELEKAIMDDTIQTAYSEGDLFPSSLAYDRFMEGI